MEGSFFYSIKSLLKFLKRLSRLYLCLKMMLKKFKKGIAVELPPDYTIILTNKNWRDKSD